MTTCGGVNTGSRTCDSVFFPVSGVGYIKCRRGDCHWPPQWTVDGTETDLGPQDRDPGNSRRVKEMLHQM